MLPIFLCAAEDIKEAKRQDRLAAEAAEKRRLENEVSACTRMGASAAAYETKDRVEKTWVTTDRKQIIADVNNDRVSI